MAESITRRETLRRGLAATSLLALAPDWVIPAIAQGELLVPFTDLERPLLCRPRQTGAVTENSECFVSMLPRSAVGPGACHDRRVPVRARR